ncbi:MAG: 50S ribosomal protein L13 [Oligoflexia bacterium]|nr:50S ribosomal protein L13 [Oligoflexia bacterium]
MSTRSLTKDEALKGRKWFVLDATDIPLGRVASRVAAVLRGKHKVTFSPHIDAGDFVVIVNAGKVKLTGAKATTRIIRHHTGFVGSVKEVSAGDLRDRNPERLIKLAVSGMLPRGPLGHQMRTKLKIYAGAEHPHKAQKLENLSLS